ncbi:GGDEF domain-containing protein [Pseudonocardia broussonetiae]|uniref:GGDEF domain-containing protein n=1 Tax=Pseudonocardia broussonetiae TaxID=2736640 RepID=A0A6M6JPZ0_9PSEU|nr:GGDEF domain-containing protein [Pseudonocardia broussonetiae]QJY49455.1 GGDEF domain-containing protein [Pseudonocardia broussonetiae]
MDEPSPAPGSRTLWGLGPGPLGLALVVELTAVAVAVAGLVALPAAGQPLLLALGLTALSVVHTELATGIERVRRRASENSYFDLSSVWTFAAALLLPPGLAAVVIVLVYVHLWHRVWAPAGIPLYRHVFTTATVLLAARAAHEVVALAGGLPADPTQPGVVLAVGLAVGSYVLVNTLLVGAVIALSGPRPVLRDLFGRWDDNALEVATLCMGALAAVALASTPALVALVLPPILVLHRAVLVRQLEQEASTDAKTGLLNAAAWQTQALRVVDRARRTGSGAGVLMLDLDHFKIVNDTHGHLAGDDVLAAVAAELRAEVRSHDVVGRFGGEEFVVLLPDLPAGGTGRTELWRVAERLRDRVSRLDVGVATSGGLRTVTGLSVSIGGATVPTDGTTLDQVLTAADASLYEAKAGGRNLVRIAADAHVPSPRRPTA